VDDLGHFGCRGVTVVRGHHAAAIDVPGARFVDNADFATTSEAWSLSLAERELVPGTVVAFGDIVVKRHIIQALLEEAGDGVTVVVDSGLAGADVPDRVRAERADSGRFSFAETRLQEIGDVPPAASHGAWIGLLHLGRDGAGWLQEAIAVARKDGTLRAARLSDLVTRVVSAGRPVRVVYTRGGWVNVNNLADLLDAGSV
jgi:phosphoenolpyruvate phosphomutase